MKIESTVQKALPAQPAQPERVTGYKVEADGYHINWSNPDPTRLTGGVCCYKPMWPKEPTTAADFRKFAAIFTEIAEALDIHDAHTEVDNARATK